MVVTRNLIFICFLAVSPTALADANDGQFLGFKLGDRYPAPRGSVPGQHITGALIYVVDPESRHQHIGSLSIYVSPKDAIIGSIFGEWYFSSKRAAEQFSDQYFGSLETRYGDWVRRRNTLSNGDYQIWVDLEQKSPFAGYWPSDGKFRISVALTFAPESALRQQWMAAISSEVNGEKLSARNQDCCVR